jgi:hypothetical protein
MSFFNYYRRFFAVAFKHPFGVADGISTALGILLPIIGRLHPKWTAGVGDLAWQVPLTAFLALVGIRLILAPYWIYRNREDQAKNAETQLRQQISQMAVGLDERAKYKETREQLGQYMAEGQELGNAFQRSGVASPYDDKTRKWVDRVEQYLATVDRSYLARFSGAPTKVFPESCYDGVRDWLNLVYSRVCQLEDFIKEHRSN